MILMFNTSYGITVIRKNRYGFYEDSAGADVNIVQIEHDGDFETMNLGDSSRYNCYMKFNSMFKNEENEWLLKHSLNNENKSFGSIAEALSHFVQNTDMDTYKLRVGPGITDELFANYERIVNQVVDENDGIFKMVDSSINTAFIVK